jgi:hypothetical protein
MLNNKGFVGYIILAVLMLLALGGAVWYFFGYNADTGEEVVLEDLNDLNVSVNTILNITTADLSNMTREQLVDTIQNITIVAENMSNTTRKVFPIVYMSGGGRRKVVPPPGPIY